MQTTKMQTRVGHLFQCLKRNSLHALAGILIAVAASAHCDFPAQKQSTVPALRKAASQWRRYKCILMLMLVMMPTSSAAQWHPNPGPIEHELVGNGINFSINAKDVREYLLQTEQLLDGFVQSQVPLAKSHLSTALHSSAERFIEKMSQQQAKLSQLHKRNSPGPWSADVQQKDSDTLESEQKAAENAADITAIKAAGAGRC